MRSSDNVQHKEYRIEKITIKDMDLILDFLRTHYCKDSPLISTLRQQGTIELEKWAQTVVHACASHSFKAINIETKEIIGIMLNRMQCRTVYKTDADGNVTLGKKNKEKSLDTHGRLMEFIYTRYSIFQNFPNENQALHLNILCINGNYRRRGIAEELINRTFDMMREMNVTICDIMCTSHYSAVLCEKMNWLEVFRMGYDQFKVNGKVTVSLPDPHREVRIFTKIVLDYKF